MGFVTDVGGLAPGSVNASGWEGVRDAAADSALCLQASVAISRHPSEYASGIEAFARQNYDLVIGSSFLLTDDLMAAAKAHPRTLFLLVDPVAQPVEPLANVVTLTFREDQAGFLAGALAGLMTRSSIIGGVYGLEGGAMTRYRLGFEHGIKYTNPLATVLGRYQGPDDGIPYNNPAWGKQVAQAWLEQGVDILFGAGGVTGKGALEAAVAAHRMCVGIDNDEALSDPVVASCLITSAVKKVRLAVTTAVDDAVRGRLPAGGNLVFDLRSGGVGLAPLHSFDALVPAEVKDRLARIGADLAAGKLATSVPLSK